MAFNSKLSRKKIESRTGEVCALANIGMSEFFNIIHDTTSVNF